ncbi:hypothetical protein IAQ61_010285 [Plenodomus lingam]|uniref:Predicted protein n=1 Tax=Leptosphaeria maculans (strain JN3 / isolate v23.1.3 / race Av1-4-5-6-7-8) TaxID=985895 RepID=E5A3H4_LEPMJ|nr:predicted protein [Plenodomus lingam JN3]KAH9862083.1 hypothetical protein IAQ61_010285 [Plenodomus lingam]CBX98187.1 predicted protein [Plenodomus lingam JN3]
MSNVLCYSPGLQSPGPWAIDLNVESHKSALMTRILESKGNNGPNDQKGCIRHHQPCILCTSSSIAED